MTRSLKKLILNQRKAYDLERQRQAYETIQKLKEGDIVESSVLRITDFGVFVDLGGLDGLIPASELTWGRFSHPKEVTKIGEVLKARIFRIEKENQRVALSVKQILGDPWDEIANEYVIGKQVVGKVVSEANFGLFVELKPGIEGLIHNSEIPENVERPKLNSQVTANVIKIDLDKSKIGLSLRNLQEATQEVINETKEIENWEIKPSLTEIPASITSDISEISTNGLVEVEPTV